MTSSNFSKVSPDQALQAFSSGYNCAQSVVKVYADALGFDEKEAVSQAAALGGGRLHGICGAASGACLVLELFCSGGVGSKGQKLCIESLIGDFRQQFQQIHGTDQCKVLLNKDAARTNDSSLSICEQCIVDAVEIVNGLLER